MRATLRAEASYREAVRLAAPMAPPPPPASFASAASAARAEDAEEARAAAAALRKKLRAVGIAPGGFPREGESVAEAEAAAIAVATEVRSGRVRPLFPTSTRGGW